MCNLLFYERECWIWEFYGVYMKRTKPFKTHLINSKIQTVHYFNPFPASQKRTDQEDKSEWQDKSEQLLRHFSANFSLFSSPEPKAQVSYCHSAPSVVRPSVRRRPSVRPSVNFHIFNFFSRTAWWILMKLGRDEVLMVPYKCCCFSARSAQGRIQGGAKIGQRGSPSSRNFFFRPEGYSDKPNG